MSLRSFSLPLTRRVQKVISLLEAASRGETNLTLAAFDKKQIRWIVETGLGPLLFRFAKNDPDAPGSPLWSLVQSANLTAQVLCEEQGKAMEEILDGCAEQGHLLTLLKGISISHQVYPEPHLRPMRDLDFLVSDAGHSFVESLLLKLGYRRESKNAPEFYEQHHHTMPFFHPQKGTWVEVHRALFPRQSEIGSEKTFSLENLSRHIRPYEFRGRKATRLSDELQTIYTACHWARDLHVIGGMIAMLDLIYLLKAAGDTFHWEEIPGLAQGSSTGTSFYVMLSYLDRRKLIHIPPEILRELSLRQRSFGRLNLRILHALIDQYLVDGKTWGIALSRRNMRILWGNLLQPGPPLRNLMLVPWHLLPSRLRPGSASKKASRVRG